MAAYDRFVVFTTNNCKWCDKAKALLTLNDKEFTAFNVNEAYSDVNLNDVNPYRYVFNAFGFKTAPQVFIVGRSGAIKHIGGFTDLRDYLEPKATGPQYDG